MMQLKTHHQQSIQATRTSTRSHKRPLQQQNKHNTHTMSTEKKLRPSPTESATAFAPETRRMGNDGKMYVVALDKNGKHRWAKYSGEETTETEVAVEVIESAPKRSGKASKPKPKPELEAEPIEPKSDDEPAEAEKPKKRSTKAKKQAAPAEPKSDDEPAKAEKPKKRSTKAKKQEEPAEPKSDDEPTEAAEPELEHAVVKKHVRKAPVEPAKNYDEGHEMCGQDGKLHIVMITKAGVKRWVHSN